jgi:hypothetical protein
MGWLDDRHAHVAGILVRVGRPAPQRLIVFREAGVRSLVTIVIAKSHIAEWEGDGRSSRIRSDPNERGGSQVQLSSIAQSGAD